ncbi:MAG: NTP transferase domain-containing protein [Actinomycetes bacterium]
MIGAIVLAAGAASRFGSPKQLLFLPYVLERLRGAPVGQIVVVAGAHAIEASETLSLDGVSVVTATDWAVGPGASLRCGLAALSAEAEAALVILADGPFLDPRAIDRVLAHRQDAPFIAASYDGIRSHPALLARSIWDAIPNDGGRDLDVLLIPCEDLTPPGDIDTPDLWNPPEA